MRGSAAILRRMRITGIEVIPLRAGDAAGGDLFDGSYDDVVVQVQTDEGLVGRRLTGVAWVLGTYNLLRPTPQARPHVQNGTSGQGA